MSTLPASPTSRKVGETWGTRVGSNFGGEQQGQEIYAPQTELARNQRLRQERLQSRL